VRRRALWPRPGGWPRSIFRARTSCVRSRRFRPGSIFRPRNISSPRRVFRVGSLPASHVASMRRRARLIRARWPRNAPRSALGAWCTVGGRSRLRSWGAVPVGSTRRAWHVVPRRRRLATFCLRSPVVFRAGRGILRRSMIFGSPVWRAGVSCGDHPVPAELPRLGRCCDRWPSLIHRGAQLGIALGRVFMLDL